MSLKSIVTRQQPFQLITVESQSSIQEALEVLRKNGISSAPVLAGGNAVGYIDVLDVLFWVSARATAEQPSTALLEGIRTSLQRPVSEIVNYSGVDRWISVSMDTPVLEAARLLAQPHVHRLAIIDPSDQTKPLGVLTQSRLVQEIKAQEKKFDHLLHRKVIEVFPPKHVEWIRKDQYVIDALKIIREKVVSGVAVVDENGKLLGNISASDLKRALAVSVENFLVGLFSGLEGFMASMTPKTYHELPGGTEYLLPLWRPVFIGFEDFAHKALDLLSQHEHTGGQHIHRVYVTDEAHRPLRVISLRDLIDYFVQGQAVASY